MSNVNDGHEGTANLARDWLAARIVFIAGFVIAISFALYWSHFHQPAAISPYDASADQSAAATEAGQAPASSNEGLAACRASIILAENIGIVPNTLKFAGGPNKTDVVGRYTCLADDASATRFSVSFDLVCHQVNDPRCIALYQASKADGTVLYQRQNAPTADSEEPKPDPGTTAPVDSAASPPPADGAADGSDGSAAPQQP